MQEEVAKEAARQGNVFRSIGLSTNFDDWLMKSSDVGQNAQGTIYMNQQEGAFSFESLDMPNNAPNTPSSSPSFAVQPIEEITKKDLKYWLCRHDELNAKFNDVMKQKRSGLKRKYDDESNEGFESQSQKVNRV